MIRRRHVRWPRAVIAVVLGFTALTGCTTTTSSSAPTTMDQTTTSAPVPAAVSETSQQPAEESSASTHSDPAVTIRDRVAASRSCLRPVSEVGNEAWSYCRTADDLELVGIEWTVDGMLNQETFALVDGTLAYASASIVRLDNGVQQLGGWQVEYVIENGAVVDHSSIGLGPTESDDWDPDAILDRWAEREAAASEVRSTN